MDDCRNCLYVGEKLKEGTSGALQGIELFCIIAINTCHEYVKCAIWRHRTNSTPHARTFVLDGNTHYYGHIYGEEGP